MRDRKVIDLRYKETNEKGKSFIQRRQISFLIDGNHVVLESPGEDIDYPDQMNAIIDDIVPHLTTELSICTTEFQQTKTLRKFARQLQKRLSAEFFDLQPNLNLIYVAIKSVEYVWQSKG